MDTQRACSMLACANTQVPKPLSFEYIRYCLISTQTQHLLDYYYICCERLQSMVRWRQRNCKDKRTAYIRSTFDSA